MFFKTSSTTISEAIKSSAVAKKLPIESVSILKFILLLKILHKKNFISKNKNLSFDVVVKLKRNSTVAKPKDPEYEGHEFWKEQRQRTGKTAVFVPSGGKGSDEIIAEGEAMKRYLLEQGIPEEYILAETNSTTTYENMKFSKELIEKINPSAKIAFSTTNYHVMRAGILACKAGLEAEGMGARTKWYFWPNALLREVVGMFAYRPKIQLLSMLILTLLAAATGYLYSLL